MNILLLEDRGARLEELKKTIGEGEHVVHDCPDVYWARDCWEEYMDHLDCIVVDLAMDPEGLGDKGKEESQRGYYTGWVFLKNYVFSQRPDFAERCVVFSAWSDSFKEDLGKKAVQKQTGFSEIQILSKNDPEWRRKLKNQLRRVEKLGRWQDA